MNNPFIEEPIENKITIGENNSLIKIDEFEEKLKQLNKLTKEYDKIKKEIKEEMLKIAKANGSKQLKWTTPKDIKITLSVGQPAEIEKVEEMRFSDELLRTKYPEIYEECKVKVEVTKTIKSGSSDRLVIALPKGDE